MHRGTFRCGRYVGLAALALVLTCLPLTACGSSGGGTPPDPDPEPVPLSVSASPAGMNSATGTTVDVTLTAAGDDAPTAKIYYTVDLSVPLAGEPGTMEYTAPVAITQDTVLKFYAAPATGDPTGTTLEGYTFADEPGYNYDWTQSGHGHIAAEAWRHWDEDGVVQTSCARCHSSEGLADWAEDGTVDNPAALSLGLACTGCHGDPFMAGTLYADLIAYPELEPVEFPSGDEASLFNSSNTCLACHQGRSSGVDVENATPNDVVQDPDYESFSFINIHYYAAAASFFGAEVNGGYEYTGLAYPTPYQDRNTFPSHYDDSGVTPVRVLSDCVGCHMGDAAPHSHTWAVDLATCEGCHPQSGTDFTTLGGSPASNYTAIQGSLTQLYAAIQTYATNLGYPIVYDSHAYPYFFNDNGAGINFGNKYDNFDEKLLQAAYNYQFGEKEPCGYIHNGTYMRQLLFDSIMDLGGTPSDAPPARPGFTPSSNLFAAKTEQYHTSGHDHLSGEAFRHWDPDYGDIDYDPTDPVIVQGSCNKCHSTLGFVYFATEDTLGADVKVGEGVGCFACHAQADLFTEDGTRYDFPLDNPPLVSVAFPETGVSLTLNDASNICMACHQGRESKEDVDAQMALPVGTAWSFQNIHYYPAGATYFGSAAVSGYEITANAYSGQNMFPAHGTADKVTCIGCHLRGEEDHFFLPLVADCGPCHTGTTFQDLTGSPSENYTDIYGAGELFDTVLNEIILLADTLPSGTIEYDASAYPYWFKGGLPHEFQNRYLWGIDLNEMLPDPPYYVPTMFDMALYTACYNYQFAAKEPGSYIHNGDYMMQLLYDSLDYMDDGDPTNESVIGFTRTDP